MTAKKKYRFDPDDPSTIDLPLYASYTPWRTWGPSLKFYWRLGDFSRAILSMGRHAKPTRAYAFIDGKWNEVCTENAAKMQLVVINRKDLESVPASVPTTN